MKTILGFTEEISSCDCCGKSNLKGTWNVEVNGSIYYLGSTCVKKKGFTTKDKTEFLNAEKKAAFKKRRAEFSAYLSTCDFSMFKKPAL